MRPYGCRILSSTKPFLVKPMNLTSLLPRLLSRVLMTLLCCQSLAVPLPAHAADPAGVQALQETQRRMRVAHDGLKQAQKAERKAEEAAADAQAEYDSALRRVDETKAQLERARQRVQAAKGDTAAAQSRYDEVKGEIETIYRLRQGSAQ